MNKIYLLGLCICFLLWGQSVSATLPEAAPPNNCLPNVNDYKKNTAYQSLEYQSSSNKLFFLAERFCKQVSQDDNLKFEPKFPDGFLVQINTLSIALGQNENEKSEELIKNINQTWSKLVNENLPIKYISADKFRSDEITKTSYFKNFISEKISITGVEISYAETFPRLFNSLSKTLSQNGIEKGNNLAFIIISLIIALVILCAIALIGYLFWKGRPQKKSAPRSNEEPFLSPLLQPQTPEILIQKKEKKSDDQKSIENKLKKLEDRINNLYITDLSNKSFQTSFNHLTSEVETLQKKVDILEADIVALKPNPKEEISDTRKLLPNNLLSRSETLIQKSGVPNTSEFLSNAEACIRLYPNVLKLDLTAEAQHALSVGGNFKLNFTIQTSKLAQNYYYAAFPAGPKHPNTYILYPKIMKYNKQHKTETGLDYVFENNLDALTASGTGSGTIKSITQPAVALYSETDQTWFIQQKGQITFGVS